MTVKDAFALFRLNPNNLEANLTIREEAEKQGHPTQGEFAVELWQLTSGNTIGVQTAKSLMAKCGYEPFMGYPLTLTTLEVVRKTAGLQSGYRTKDEVETLFGVDVTSYPKLFRLTRSGLVEKLPEHERTFQAHIANVKANWHALGVNA